MLPSLRLLIAAMSATVVVLMCGFGVFAAFRVSYEPIAHLPAAAAPLRLFAETEAASSAVVAARESADQHSQFDVPTGASEPAAPDAPAAEQHAAAEPAADELPTAALSSAAKNAASTADDDAENESAATTPQQQPAAVFPPVGQIASSPQGDSRHGEIEADAASDFALPRPLAPAAEYSNTTDKAIDAAAVAATAPAENAPGSQQTSAEAPGGKTLASLNLETEPAAGAHPAVGPTRDDAAGRGEPERRPKPSPPVARRSMSRGPPAIEARRVERPVRRLSITGVVKPKRPHVAVARMVRAVRFTAPYYAQYAQSAQLSYGYGQGASAGQDEAAVRQVVRLQAARWAARRVNSAMGGPFVRAPSQ
jgi:hypothetical protein